MGPGGSNPNAYSMKSESAGVESYNSFGTFRKTTVEVKNCPSSKMGHSHRPTLKQVGNALRSIFWFGLLRMTV